MNRNRIYPTLREKQLLKDLKAEYKINGDHTVQSKSTANSRLYGKKSQSIVTR